MQYYLAPLEGITTYIFRTAFHNHFKDPDKYFTPFLSNKKPTRRELDDILPDHNLNIHLIPQILTNRSEDFLEITAYLKEYGYRSVNLNLGCPSGTVVSKKRGAGFLSDPVQLDYFLDEIFEKSPLSISIKTRLGMESTDEWGPLLDIFSKYPMEELIIHPRLRSEYYSGIPHRDVFLDSTKKVSIPLCFNGDIVDYKSYITTLTSIPSLDRIMIGRGAVSAPWIFDYLKNKPSDEVSSSYDWNHTKKQLLSFHNEVYAAYRERMSGEKPVIFKMKDLWNFMYPAFSSCDKQLKQLRKANTLKAYEAAVSNLFSLELNKTPFP